MKDIKNLLIKLLNHINVARILGLFCKLLGLYFAVRYLIEFGEYIADYHMNEVVTTYLILSLTFFFYLALHKIIKIVRWQLEIKKNEDRGKKRQKLLEYHDHKNHHYYY